MQIYSYEAIDSSGEQVVGETAAANVTEAIVLLEESGLKVQSIRLVQGGDLGHNSRLAEFHQRVAGVMARRPDWIPILMAIAAELPRGAVRRQITSLVSRVKSTSDVEQFLNSPDLAAMLPLLQDERDGGFGVQQLKHWLANLVRHFEVRQARRKALIYPSVVFVLAFILLVVCSHTLIRHFGTMYLEFGLSLPGPTLACIWVAEQVTTYWLRTVVVVGVATLPSVLLFRTWRRHAWTNRLFGQWVAGSNENLAAMATLTSSLAELLQLKAPLDEALRIAGRCCQHAYYRAAAENLATDVSQQSMLPSQSNGAKRLPVLVICALQTGEGGAPNTPLLREISAVYSDRSRHRMDWFAVAFPVLAMLGIGMVVAFVTISLFMPLVSMVTSLS